VYLTYDAAWRLSSEAYYDAEGLLVEEIVYTYDAAGNRVTRTDATGTAVSSYTSGWQLARVAAPNGTETYTYDADGRVTAITRDAKTLTLTYDTTDQLTAVHMSPDNMHMTYAANGMGHRIHAQDVTGTRRFVVGPTLVEELASPYLITDTAGTLRMGYVYAGEQPLMRFNAEGPVYYLTDGNGSVMALADTTGTRVARFAYNSFGQLRTTDGPAADSPATAGGDFRYHGAWLEATTGLYHMRAREYDPRTGRFLSRDPAEPDLFEPESLHPYVFAYGNPHVYRDPTGTVTLYELNMGMSGRQILQNIRSLAFREFTDYFRRKAGEIGTEILFRQLESLLPGEGPLRYLSELLLERNEDERGGKFERLAERELCKIATFMGDRYRKWIWLEAELDSSGTPLSDGRKCGPARKSKHSSATKPDYIFSIWPPTELGGLKRGFLIGDFKISMKALYNAYAAPRAKKISQWNALASFARRYQYLPVTLFVTLWDGPQWQREQLKARAVAGSRVIITIVALR
jgi:RHS repeat-associated protein